MVLVQLEQVMSRNNRQEGFYLSQAVRKYCPAHSHKQYTSGTVTPPSQQLPNKQRAIDSQPIYSTIKHNPLQRQLIRNRSVQVMRCGSPVRDGQRLGGFRGVIEELNQNNDQALSQLDGDLKRIKTNLDRVTMVEGKRGEEIQALTEEVVLMQEENQRLRERNLEEVEENSRLKEEKKKLLVKLQQYEKVYDNQIAKQTTFPARPSEQLIRLGRQRKEMEERWMKLQLEYEELKIQSSNLSCLKDSLQRRCGKEMGERGRAEQRVKQLQKQIQVMNNKNEEKLAEQVSKKQSYYYKMLQLSQNQIQQSVKTILSSNRESELTVVELNEILKGKNEQIEVLKTEVETVRERDMTREKVVDRLENKLKQVGMEYQGKVDSLNSQIQFLNYAHKQAMETVQQRDREMINQQKRVQEISIRFKELQRQRSGCKLGLQEEKSRYDLLCQLYNRLEKQSMASESSHQTVIDYHRQSMQRIKLQLKRTKIQLADEQTQRQQLQSQIKVLSKQNESLLLDSRRKSQQILLHKHQHFNLLKSYQTINQVENVHSPSKYQRRERVNSGQFRRVYLQRDNGVQKLGRIRAVERELDEVMRECRSQMKQERETYRVKIKQLKDRLQGQQMKIVDLNQRIEHLKTENENLGLQKINNKQQMGQIVQEKCNKIGQLQVKIGRLSNQKNKVQMQVQLLKDHLVQSKTSLMNSQKIKEQQSNKLQQVKSHTGHVMSWLFKQIKQLESEHPSKIGIDLWRQLGNVSYLGDMRLESELTFGLHALRQSIGNLRKQNRQLEKQIEEKNSLLQSHKIQQKVVPIKSYVEALISPKKQVSESTTKSNWQQQCLRELTSKFNDLQCKFQLKTIKQQEELVHLRDQNASLQREKSRLKEKLDRSEEEIERKDEQIRQINKQIKSLRNRDTHQEHLLDLVTPIKTRKGQLWSEEDSEGQREVRMRKRVRSNRHQSPLSPREVEYQKNSGELMHLEMINATLKNNLEDRRAEIQGLKLKIVQLQSKVRHWRQKHDEREKECSKASERVHRIKRDNANLECQVLNLQGETEALLDEMEGWKQKYEAVWQDLSKKKELLAKQIRQNHFDRQVVERRGRQQTVQKQSMLLELKRQYELKHQEQRSEMDKLKQKVKQFQTTLKYSNEKYGKLEKEVNQLKQQLKIKEQFISRLEQQRKEINDQKQRISESFKIDANKLSQLLQEKQIEVEELKFIRESTMINMESTGSRINKKIGDSAFSFASQS